MPVTATYKLYQKCTVCNGNGSITTTPQGGSPQTITCPTCNGDKRVEWGEVDITD